MAMAQRLIQIPIKHLRWSVVHNGQRLKVANYFKVGLLGLGNQVKNERYI